MKQVSVLASLGLAPDRLDQFVAPNLVPMGRTSQPDLGQQLTVEVDGAQQLSLHLKEKDGVPAPFGDRSESRDLVIYVAIGYPLDDPRAASVSAHEIAPLVKNGVHRQFVVGFAQKLQRDFAQKTLERARVGHSERRILPGWANIKPLLRCPHLGILLQRGLQLSTKVIIAGFAHVVSCQGPIETLRDHVLGRRFFRIKRLAAEEAFNRLVQFRQNAHHLIVRQ